MNSVVHLKRRAELEVRKRAAEQPGYARISVRTDGPKPCLRVTSVLASNARCQTGCGPVHR